MKEITIYNMRKGRLETVRYEFTVANTTWFDDGENINVYLIADGSGGFLIQESGYSYPVLIDDVSRSDIGNNQEKALELQRQQT